ncbi:FRAS1-related extracellular matrix protein 1a [Syngnathoides biaculeatus]|uniref:FRAS1-related extracellular matrix protein 1a n=1 Tax=Syngnathoides biaculeatus TaxID=300417 RepID=UPI002ADD5B6B|nr:FRAS1-related extracellular matrix protein 1a [Syngnathoides biaculeatus]
MMKSKGQTLGLLLFLLLGMTCNGSLVNVNRALKVSRGQSAYLRDGDLHFLIPLQNDACKVEVVLNEPITQRVGKFLPRVFNCHYQENEIRYVHNGSPLLTEDTVKLRVYRFTETETHIEDFSLHVEITESDCSRIKLGPTFLQVPVYGISGNIDGNVVSFHYERRSSLECSIHFSSQDTHLPAHGQVVTGNPVEAAKRGDVPLSYVEEPPASCDSDVCLKGVKPIRFIKVPCDQFLLMGLKYQHMTPPSPDIDYIAIRLDLKDTRSGNIYQSEQIWIPVQITDALVNQAPALSFTPTFILEVDQFVLTLLSTTTLDAEDEETPQDRLIFNITKAPSDGFITHLSDQTRPINSFTWLDLNGMLIAYQPPNSSHTQRRNIEMEIEVNDFFFKKSPPVTAHMSVRNADTNAPRVSWNMGLSLLEGQSRPITWEQLQIVDNDDIEAVRVIAVDGLLHGRLTVRGGKGFTFSISDIQAGTVCYHHDDSDSTSDFIVFRITDGHHQTRHKFPIKILPKDDSPPFLIANKLLEASQGQKTLLKGTDLQASDMDSSSDYILFNVTRPPQAGEIMKFPGPKLTGYPVSTFLQRDLSRSMVYYRHTGNEVFDDSFEFVLSDFQDPPNLSEPQVVLLHIEPVMDKPPREVPSARRSLVVKETDVVHITQQHLHFVDKDSPGSDLTYMVTSPPFFSDHHSSEDAGRLFLVDSIPKFTKDTNAPVLRLFTQHAINFMKVAYMPPTVDVGPFPQYIQFVLSVTNQHGKKLDGISFNITVVPVDNQPPQVITNPVMVDEGGECRLGPEHLLLSDVDSVEEALHLELLREPQHGALQLNNFPLKPGQTFSLHDLTSHIVRYSHDNSETAKDNIELAVTDGVNKISFILQVKVSPINDEVPVLVAGLKPVLACGEGQTIAISSEYIDAIDADTDNNSLAFLIARQPRHGLVLRNGMVVDNFIRADINAGMISYKHTGQEIGLTPHHDTITFVISDGETEKYALCCSGRKMNIGSREASLPVYDLQITILPLNSQPPSLKTGDTFVVDEGGRAQIKASHLKVSDVDTVADELVVSLVTLPQFGYLENVLPRPGFEKSNVGVSIDSCFYRDIVAGQINYVQSRHQNQEPTADQFIVYVSDGKFRSSHVTFNVVVNPTNDEIPEFAARNITVQEGQLKHLDQSVLNATDLDLPENILLFHVVQPPRHGNIIRRRYVDTRQDANLESAVVDFTMAELTNGKAVAYTHDDSEHLEDSFTVELSDGRHKIQKRVTVEVLAVNDDKPYLIRNNRLEVEPGETRLITSVTLFAQDHDTPSSQVMYIFKSVPTQGFLQLKHVQDWLLLKEGGNCTQEMVDVNRLRYVHRDSFSTTRQDFFIFYLHDGQNQSPLQQFNISVKHVEKGSISIFVRPVSVTRGGHVVLTTDLLLATDAAGRPEELVFVVTTPAAHGYLENIKHPGVTISTFSQMDVTANRVAYVHDKRASTPTEFIQFVVSNNERSRKGVLEVSVEMFDHIPPSLSNKGLLIPQGFTMTLTPDCLSMSDPDTPHGALVFKLLQPPRHGELLLHETTLTAGSTFTQQNIEELEVTYKHNGDQSQIDQFEFTATDSTHRGVLVDGKLHPEPLFFIIQIELLDTSHPEVVKLLPLWKAELLTDGRYGIFLSSRELRAKDNDSKEEELMFSIVRQPHFGYLENITTGSFVRQRIPQLDLKRRMIVYIINPEMESLTDSLEFRVSDPHGNTGPSCILQLNWSSVELSQTEYCATEEEKRVSVEISRKGNTAESSYVTVKVNEVTATAGKDFLSRSSSLIQFDPGVTRRSLNIEVIQDQLEEADEEFEVLLILPEGTVIGSVKKAQVTIKDSGRGQCKQNQGHASSVLRGKIVQSDKYVQKLSGRLQKLSLGTQSAVHEQVSFFKKNISVEDKSKSKGRRAKMHVVSKVGKQRALAELINLKHDPQRTLPNPGKSKNATTDTFAHKSCSPEVMGILHFNPAANQIFYCNGVSWRSWRPTEQMVKSAPCPRGWTFRSRHCYILIKKHKSSWTGANRSCKERYKGTLASVFSKRDMDWLWNFGRRRPFWIGLTERDSQGSWEWADGGSVVYTNWTRAPSPSSVKGGKKCALVWWRARWQRRDCKSGRAHSFICAVKI